MFSMLPISLLIKPLTMSDMTSISRADNFLSCSVLGTGGRWRPCECADCSRASSERTSFFSGTDVHRQWNPANVGWSSEEADKTIVLPRLPAKNCKFPVTVFVDAK